MHVWSDNSAPPVCPRVSVGGPGDVTPPVAHSGPSVSGDEHRRGQLTHGARPTLVTTDHWSALSDQAETTGEHLQAPRSCSQ